MISTRVALWRVHTVRRPAAAHFAERVDLEVDEGDEMANAVLGRLWRADSPYAYTLPS